MDEELEDLFLESGRGRCTGRSIALRCGQLKRKFTLHWCQQASEHEHSPAQTHCGQQKAGVKAAAKADISGLSDSLLLCAPRLRAAVMTGPGCRSKKTHAAAENHPTPSPASSPHPVPGRLTAPAAGSSTPPPQPATSNHAAQLLACFCLSPPCRLPQCVRSRSGPACGVPCGNPGPRPSGKPPGLPGSGNTKS